jgi:hypothetical protein
MFFGNLIREFLRQKYPRHIQIPTAGVEPMPSRLFAIALWQYGAPAQRPQRSVTTAVVLSVSMLSAAPLLII